MPYEPSYYPVTKYNLRKFVLSNGVEDTHSGLLTDYSFVIDVDNVGNDKITDFDAGDTLVMMQKLYDKNKDGVIGFGADGLLDIYRTNRMNGYDMLDITYEGASIGALRYIGMSDGGYIYAKASTFTDLKKTFANVVESSTRNETFASKADGVLFIDNNLGMDTGRDVVTNTQVGQKIVLTYALKDNDKDGIPNNFVNHGTTMELPLHDQWRLAFGNVTFEGVNANTTLMLTSEIVEHDAHFYVYTVTEIAPSA